MAKFKEKLEAQKLRRKGQSIKSIAQILEVSKSSASIWCRNIKLTRTQQERLWKNAIAAGHRGRMIGAETNRKRKQELINTYKEQGYKDIGNLSNRDILIAGLALYWAEGSKKENKINFINSDPEMIKFMFEWFRKVMNVPTEDFMPRIFINEMHVSRIQKVLKFWSSLLKLPISQFKKTIFIKTKQKKVYENYDNYYGILSIRIRNSSKLIYRTLGLIDALKYKNKKMPR